MTMQLVFQTRTPLMVKVDRHYHMKTTGITQNCPSKSAHMITFVIGKNKELL